MRVLLLCAALLTAIPLASAGVVEVPLGDGLSKPMAIAPGPDGRMWATLEGSWQILAIDPATLTREVYALEGRPAGDTDSLYGLAFTPDGRAWTASTTHLHVVDPATKEARAIELPARTMLSGGVIVDDAGDVWVALVSNDLLVRYSPSTEETTTLQLPRGWGPLEFAPGENGRILVTGTYANTYGTLDPTAREMFPAPDDLLQAPTGVARRADGIWMGEHGAWSLAHLDAATDTLTRYPTAPSPFYPVSGPSGIALHPDGSVWFAVHFADRVARFDPAARTLIEYQLPNAPGANVQRVAVAPDGAVWFGEWSRDRLGHATYTGETLDSPLPARLSVAQGTTARIPFVADVEARFGLPLEGMEARIEGDEILLDIPQTLATGEYEILVSVLRGATYVGRYVTLDVNERAETPSAGLTMLLAVSGALALIARRRRA